MPPPLLPVSRTFPSSQTKTLYPLNNNFLFLLPRTPRAPGNHHCTCCLWGWELWVPHLRGIIQYLSFGGWYSLGIMSSRFSPVSFILYFPTLSSPRHWNVPCQGHQWSPIYSSGKSSLFFSGINCTWHFLILSSLFTSKTSLSPDTFLAFICGFPSTLNTVFLLCLCTF